MRSSSKNILGPSQNINNRRQSSNKVSKKVNNKVSKKVNKSTKKSNNLVLSMDTTNSKYNDSNNNPTNMFGFSKETIKALKELNTPEMKKKTRGYIMEMKDVKFYKNNYLKPCKEGEDPYYPYLPKSKQRPRSGKYKKISLDNPKEYSKFGFIMPLDEDIEDGIMVPADRKPRCYTSKSSIKKGSVKLGKLCYKDLHCEVGKCSGAFMGIAEGKCKVPRKKTDVEEGNKCKVKHECRRGLKCSGNWGGLKLGQCIKDENAKESFSNSIKRKQRQQRLNRMRYNNTMSRRSIQGSNPRYNTRTRQGYNIRRSNPRSM